MILAAVLPTLLAAQALPQRVVLTWAGDPATSAAVSWRTPDESPASAQITVAKPSPDLQKDARTVAGTTIPSPLGGSVRYHTVRFTGLQPDTLYAYRVGGGNAWSEWTHFRTGSRELKPFSFLYLGDAQNDIRSLWSRAIRGAFQESAKARFILHAGDLINHADSDSEWGEWFDAGGWIHGSVPTVATPGNHEYTGGQLSKLWRPQFEFPRNGVPGLEETNYTFVFQGVRIISLDSNRALDAQAAWLDAVLQKDASRWTVVTFHHPVFSVAGTRDNPALRRLWQPVLERHGVDLVLQGHDHTYGRTKNTASGTNARSGSTVYVVSVSGPKMYRITDPEKRARMQRVGEGIQLYQVVHVEPNRLLYRAYTVTGTLHDSFEIRRESDGKKRVVEAG